MRRHGWTFFVAEMLFVGTLSAAKPADLTIAMQFDHSVSASALQEMKNEFERILRPAAPNIEWRMRSDVAGNEVFHEIIVVRFLGSCGVDGLQANPLMSRFLAITDAEDGDLLPFPIVDCRELLGMLFESAGGRNTFQVQRLLGLAMGRVLAHEVYHVVLKTRSHAQQGIAKSSFTAAELFGAPLRFDPTQIERLKLMSAAAQ
jgi:hypothetical protein